MANYKALSALAEIRDYLREINSPVPAPIVNDFNVVAKSLGGSEDWMIQD